MKKWIVILLVGSVVGISILMTRDDQASEIHSSPAITTRIPVISPLQTPAATRVQQVVPFTAQAPFGNWSDPRQQDGCEEASILVVMKWVRGESMTLQQALEELLELSAFGEDEYGTYHDTSMAYTIKFFRDFYHHDKAVLKKDVTIKGILDALRAGSVVIVPTNGRILKNPNYTAPGPEHHMLVITGFEGAKGEFITNDPGTRRGNGYRYSYARLFNAIADYPTGIHLPRTGEEKLMIVVSR